MILAYYKTMSLLWVNFFDKMVFNEEREKKESLWLIFEMSKITGLLGHFLIICEILEWAFYQLVLHFKLSEESKNNGPSLTDFHKWFNPPIQLWKYYANSTPVLQMSIKNDSNVIFANLEKYLDLLCLLYLLTPFSF